MEDFEHRQKTEKGFDSHREWDHCKSTADRLYAALVAREQKIEQAAEYEKRKKQAAEAAAYRQQPDVKERAGSHERKEPKPERSFTPFGPRDLRK